MSETRRHSEEDCVCIQYAPEFQAWDIRLNGINFICRRCNRYVDPKKWKGGIVKFTNRTVFKPYYCCPCCGQRMSRHRIGKKKLNDSIQHQLQHPEQHHPQAQKTLKEKLRILNSKIMVPTIK